MSIASEKKTAVTVLAGAIHSILDRQPPGTTNKRAAEEIAKRLSQEDLLQLYVMSACLPAWTKADASKAAKQGWGVFVTDDGLWEIQRLDDPPTKTRIFAYDRDAVEYVRYNTTCKVCEKARKLHWRLA